MKIVDLHKKYNDLYVLKNLNMEISEQKICAIMGPSGCGKTTLLNIIASIIEKDQGKLIEIEDKKKSYLFQEPRLIPWKTVYENIGFVLKGNYNKIKANEIIHETLKDMELEEFKYFYPDKLSGGMRQRVALARAFSYPCDILLMDEPFKSLDLELRYNLMLRFMKMWKKQKPTVIFVTHDIQAAVMLSDYIYILSNKPTKVCEIIENNIPIKERYFYNKEFLQLEKTLYNKLIKISDYIIEK
ncbi:ABC transporter ATP-binding protein [Clostridium grantii]|uniref:NitT/TauT family transport system ATP-binding protein n=1 Tax=Clostridium grantii DSM 8605 TaxID=1121316 RepID=A0A1M5UD47_9CLOT|nr:NitT/TauT family transport system ATP-binding protein [Clostridium grantii DSM 8605]